MLYEYIKEHGKRLYYRVVCSQQKPTGAIRYMAFFADSELSVDVRGYHFSRRSWSGLKTSVSCVGDGASIIRRGRDSETFGKDASAKKPFPHAPEIIREEEVMQYVMTSVEGDICYCYCLMPRLSQRRRSGMSLLIWH